MKTLSLKLWLLKQPRKLTLSKRSKPKLPAPEINEKEEPVASGDVKEAGEETLTERSTAATAIAAASTH